MEVRKGNENNMFYDIYYKDLITDPIGTVYRIYQYFDYPLDPTMEEGIKRWLYDNPQNKHGSHKYSLSQFGLDKASIKQSFMDYSKRFGIQPE